MAGRSRGTFKNNSDYSVAANGDRVIESTRESTERSVKKLSRIAVVHQLKYSSVDSTPGSFGHLRACASKVSQTAASMTIEYRKADRHRCMYGRLHINGHAATIWSKNASRQGRLLCKKQDSSWNSLWIWGAQPLDSSVAFRFRSYSGDAFPFPAARTSHAFDHCIE